MDTGLNKPSNRSLAIAEHLSTNYGFGKNYNSSHFSIFIKERNDYYLCGLESLFIKTF